uniref:Uncharacterized protein n=1 Tax=Arundo donax TaxID=35708 RepID=A0A0A9C0K1_ARUDO
MMIFLNGSDVEVDFNRFGISPLGVSPENQDHVVVWTFNRWFLTMHHQRAQDEIAGKLRAGPCRAGEKRRFFDRFIFAQISKQI